MSALTDSRAHHMVGRAAPLICWTGWRSARPAAKTIGVCHRRGRDRQDGLIQTAVDRLSQQGVDHRAALHREVRYRPVLPAIDRRAGDTLSQHEWSRTAEVIRTDAPTWMLERPGSIGVMERAAFQREVFGATRERMLREFCDLVEALSADRPWVIVSRICIGATWQRWTPSPALREEIARPRC